MVSIDGAGSVGFTSLNNGASQIDFVKWGAVAQSDRFTSAKWDGLLGTFDLVAIEVTDFEMIEAGPRIPLTYDCVRIDPIFVDGFELGDDSKWSR